MRGNRIRNKQLGGVLMLMLSICVAGGMAQAAIINITAPDLSLNTTFSTVGNGTGGLAGATGVAGENNETMQGTVSNQGWDLEAMFLNTETLELTLSGGWNFEYGTAGSAVTGAPAYASSYDDNFTGNPFSTDNEFTSGDIFISVGQPLYGAAAPDPPFPTLASAWGYEYVIDIDWSSPGGGLGYSVYQVAGTNATVVRYSQFEESNPWILDPASVGSALPVLVGDFPGTPVPGGTATQVTNVLGNYGDYVNQVTFDVSWLADVVTDDADVYFHFTMECGNDMMMGVVPGGTYFEEAPEPASVALLGMGLIGMAAARFRRKQR